MFCIIVYFVMEKRHKHNSYTHILKYTSLFGGVQGLNILVGIVRNKLVATILGPEGMGLVSLFNSTIKLVSDSTNLGLSMSAVRNLSEAFESGDDAEAHRIVGTVRLWSLLTALIGTLACAVLSPLLNRWTFTWGDHTLHFVLLAPVVGLMAITGGELAILKAGRHLRSLAASSVYNMLFALACSVPIYYFFGQAGIVPSLVLLALGQCVLTVMFSFHLYPLSVWPIGRRVGEGSGMVRLGLAFVVAGVLGSGAEFVVRTFLNRAGDLTAVGLYNAGFMMTMTYAGMVFSAMETDYFPRLSAISGYGMRFNQTVSRQVEVSLLLVSPLLVWFAVALPLLLPLLYSGKFMPAVGMMRVAVLAMYCRALTLPVEYIALARGHSRSYLLLETIYDVLFVALVVVGYKLWGLTGTGIGLAVVGIVNVAVVYAYARFKYHYRPSPQVRLYTLIHLPLGLAACAVSSLLHGWAYWVVGLSLALLATVLSVRTLHSKANLWQSLRQRAAERWHKLFNRHHHE